MNTTAERQPTQQIRPGSPRHRASGRIDLDTAKPRNDLRPGGWGVLPAWVWRDPTISPEAKTVLGGISTHYAQNGGGAWPAIDTLAGYLGRSRRQTMRVLNELVELQLVEKYHRFDLGQQRTTLYVLCFDRWGSPVDKSDRGDTKDTPRGVTDVTPTRVADVTPTRVADVTRTAPRKQDQEKQQSNPLTPLPGQGGTEVVGQDRATTRAERKALDRVADAEHETCDTCGEVLPAPCMLVLSNGRRVPSIGGQIADGFRTYRSRYWHAIQCPTSNKGA